MAGQHYFDKTDMQEKEMSGEIGLSKPFTKGREVGAWNM